MTRKKRAKKKRRRKKKVKSTEKKGKRGGWGGQEDAKAQGTPGRNTRNARDNGGAHSGKKKRKRKGGDGKKTKKEKRGGRGGAPRCQGPRQLGPENKGRQELRRRRKGEKGNPSPEGAEQTKNAARPAIGKGEAHHNAPARPARPTRPSRARTRTHTRDPGVASSDPKGAVSASTRNCPGAAAESPVKKRTVQETRRVSDRVHTRQPPQRTQPKTHAGGTRQGQPHRGAPNGYDAE